MIVESKLLSSQHHNLKSKAFAVVFTTTNSNPIPKKNTMRLLKVATSNLNQWAMDFDCNAKQIKESIALPLGSNLNSRFLVMVAKTTS